MGLRLKLGVIAAAVYIIPAALKQVVKLPQMLKAYYYPIALFLGVGLTFFALLSYKRWS